MISNRETGRPAIEGLCEESRSKFSDIRSILQESINKHNAKVDSKMNASSQENQRSR